MESNVCDANHSDADVLLPPRKRLLAGLRKQNSDGNSLTPSPTSSGSNGSELNLRLSNLLRSHLSIPNISNDEIVELSRKEAEEAEKVAQAARSTADEKAAKAAKAIAAAKSALELVATLEEEASSDKHPKNKTKKHVTVKALYNKRKGDPNGKADVESARKLQRGIKNSRDASALDLKNHKQTRVKSSLSVEKNADHFGGKNYEVNLPSSSNVKGTGRETDSENTLQEEGVSRIDDRQKIEKKDESQFNMTITNETVEKEVVNSTEKSPEKKKAKMKQKKLPLSVCSSRDLASPRGKLKSKQLPPREENGASRSRTSTSSKALLPGGSSGNNISPVQSAAIWKCQTFKAPECVKENKVMQS